MSKSILNFIELPTITDDCRITIAEGKSLPFVIKRLYYIYAADTDVPRGMHAHYQTSQVLFCLAGSIKMLLDDGSVREECLLDSPSKGILLKPMIWHEMHDFQQDTILLVVASHVYDPMDYMRDYQQFLSIVKD